MRLTPAEQLTEEILASIDTAYKQFARPGHGKALEGTGSMPNTTTTPEIPVPGRNPGSSPPPEPAGLARGEGSGPLTSGEGP